MAEPDKDEIRASEETDPGRMLRRVRRLGLFESLRRIYAQFPETTCDHCARCCFESPGVFFVEHLHLLELLADQPEARRELLLRRALGELFFSWIDPERTCFFLESSRCVIYERRPLACRLFGLVAPAEREEAEAEARLAAREEARRLRLLGIEMPEAVVRRSLASCDRVRDRRGQRVGVDGDAIAARVGKLDAALLPQQVVVQEFCFRSLPERLAAAALGGEVVEGMRVQLLRRAQRGEGTGSLLETVLKEARFPGLPRKRKQGR